MEHALYPSVDELLAPETLTSLTGHPVTAVDCRPYQPENSRSGSRFLVVETDGGRGPRYFVKRISTEWDWIMRATDDSRGREALIWQSGLLDRLPPGVAHAVVGCAIDGRGWAILLRDVTAALAVWGGPSGAQLRPRALDALADLHAAFLGCAALNGVAGLCSLPHRYTALGPATGRREAAGPDVIPPLLVRGWEYLPELIPPAVAELVFSLLADPRPLCAALGHYPQTLAHGDTRIANLGWMAEPPGRIVLIDWQFAGGAPPAVDLAWYLWMMTNHTDLGDSQGAIAAFMEGEIEAYRTRLARQLGARFDPDWWRPQLELGLLGGLVSLGWNKSLGAMRGDATAVRAQLAWWSAQALRGARWL